MAQNRSEFGIAEALHFTATLTKLVWGLVHNGADWRNWTATTGIVGGHLERLFGGSDNTGILFSHIGIADPY